MKTLSVGMCIGMAVAATTMKARQSSGAADGGIVISNFKEGETLRYSTPLIMGSLTNEKAATITLVNKASKRPTREMTGLAAGGRFKVLADLVPGPNKLVLSCGDASTSLTLVFKRQTNPYVVRAVYYMNRTGDRGYLSPVKDDPQDVAGKLSTAMLLMQSFSAECMNRQGYGRRTFNVDLQEDGRVKVFFVKGDQAPDSGLDGGALDKAIEAQAARPQTHYFTVLGKGCGYTAIGGGGKALFGGSCIYSWPDSIQAAQAAFMDATPIDGEKFHVDAVGRDVFWANTSTCLGACLHEIDHTFGLPHSMDGRDIMTRGFDGFNRFFTLIEPPSKQNANVCEFKDDETATYCKVTANNLACSRFFALEDRNYSEQYSIEIEYKAARNEIAVKSDKGIAFLGLEVPYANPGAGYCVPIDPGKSAPKRLTIPARDWERFEGKPFQVRVIDVEDHCAIDRDPLKGHAATKKK